MAATPQSVRSAAAAGKVRFALGPWRASGGWWEPGAWEREEWDVLLRDHQVVRLVKEAGGWTVAGMLD
jgi:hypothetical protein